MSATYKSAVLALVPAAYWRCNEASGNLADATANANTMVAQGTPSYSVPGGIPGDPDTAIALNGNSANFFSAANSASLNVADVFTVVAWVKRAALDADMSILTRGTYGYGVHIRIDKLLLTKQDVTNIVYSTLTITDKNWHMVAVTKNGSAVNLYIDGADVTGAITPDTCAATGGVTNLGSYATYNTLPWNGSLDEVALWGSALTAANITTLWQAAQAAIVPNAATVFLYTPNPPWTRLGVIDTAGEIHRGFLLMEKGLASFTASNDDPLIAAVPGALDIGSTILILSNVAGVPPWLGWVRRIEEELGSGRSLYTCEDFVGTFVDGTRTPDVYKPPSKGVASIARLILTQAAPDRGLPLAVDRSQDAGPALIQTLPVDTLLATFKRMFEMTGYEWRFDISINPTGAVVVTPIWSSIAGRDLSNSILLREGTHFSQGRYTQDAKALYETTAVVGGTGSGDRPITIRQTLSHSASTNAGSIRYGKATGTWASRRGAQFARMANQRQAVVYEPGVTAPSDLAGRALTEMELPLNAVESLEFTMSLDALMGEDAAGMATLVFPFWVGDTIAIVSDSLRQKRGLYRNVRCHGLTIDEAKGTVEGIYSVESGE